MNSKDLMAISKVVQLLQQKHVNLYLAKGWKLLDVASGKDEQGYPFTMYVLGWPGEGEAVEPSDAELHGSYV